MSSGPDLSSVPGWRVGLLFVTFLVILAVWNLLFACVKRLLLKSPGLLRVVAVVQEEILALGVISLAIAALQLPLGKICIDCPDCSDKEHCKVQATEACLQHYQGSSAYVDPTELDDEGHCPHGQQPFWPELVLEQAHLLLFLLAAAHIFYATICLVLCLWRMRSWRTWDQRAKGACRQACSLHAVPRVGSTPASHYGRACLMQFTTSMNSCMYLGVRRAFLQRLQLPSTFDFHAYVVDIMQVEFANAIEVQWIMWIIAVVWVSLPDTTYALFWMVGTFMLLSLVLGVHLVSVMMRLAAEAHSAKGERLQEGWLWDTFHGRMNTTSEAGGSVVKPLKSLKPGLAWLVQSPGDVFGLEAQEHSRPLDPDFKRLFWFGTPSIILHAQQYSYFQTALTVAWILLGIWQQLNWDLTSASGAEVYVVMIVANILLTLHSSLVVLPIYGLAQAVGVTSLPPEQVARFTCDPEAEESLEEEPIVAECKHSTELPVYDHASAALKDADQKTVQT
ncbi:hypothetical protein WJX72_008632 [[Myrmecia] bisecta]|uniref:MLO-like protein n=1 Tax=[Myrmecia] bisecta TaxID=41462 RepID=A0AAW1R8G1_9CHLO